MLSRIFPPGVPIQKRIFDLTLTIPVLVLASPFMAIIALMVWLIHGWPVLFRQKRTGYRMQSFKVTKFRTMTDKRDSQGNPLPDDQRITPLGGFLRRSSLDELPELFHVLYGEMSLIGPRPLMDKYRSRYSPQQARRFEVLPGITGWAQINGRNVITWEDKFRLDVWYVDHWSFWLDVKILLLTIWKVIKREGISQPGHATAEEFMGANGNLRGEAGE